MESEDGSKEPGDEFTADMVREAMAKVREEHYSPERRNALEGFSMPMAMFKGRMLELMRLDEASSLAGPTAEEVDRIADGEPYCFRCGKPASSFSEYCDDDGECDGPPYVDAVSYVRQEEGTYNPDTNRFACDACYIAIGTPAAPGGWRAP